MAILMALLRLGLSATLGAQGFTAPEALFSADLSALKAQAALMESPRAAPAPAPAAGNRDMYRIGDEWGRKPVRVGGLGDGSAVIRRAAQATASYGGATAFYLGKFNGHHIMATNHHISLGRCRGDARFPLLGKTYACEKIYGDWKEVDLTLFSIRVPVAEEAGLLPSGRNFAYDAGIRAGQELLIVGFGAADNPDHAMTAAQDADCKVFSAADEFRLVRDPDQVNPVGYPAWSFANGCDISHGDSGAAVVDRMTGDVLGIHWTGKIPKSESVADSASLRRMLQSGSPEIWTELTFGVPAAKIRESILKDLRTGSGGGDWARTMSAVIGRPEGPVPTAGSGLLSGNENIKRLWLRMLEGSQALGEYHEFIRRNEVDIRFVGQIEQSLLGAFYAAFENGQILISQQLVDASLAELARQGFGGAEAEELFARKTIDLIVHELAHARLEEQIRDELRLKLTLPLLEDETLAYFAQARALTEFQDIFSFDTVRLAAVMDMQKMLFNSFYSGCDGLRAYINQWNPVLSLRDQKELLDRLHGYLKPIEASLGTIEGRIRALRQGADPREGLTREDELGRLEDTKAKMQANRRNLQENLDIFSSPRNFEDIQRFYRTRLGRVCGGD